MTIDDLREKVRANDREAELRIELRGGAIARTLRTRARSATTRLFMALWFELGFTFLVAAALPVFAATHGEGRFLIPAILLEAFAVLHVGFSALQVVALARVDLDAPVAEVQRKLEGLRIGRIRMVKWSLLLGPLVFDGWIVVQMRWQFGVDLYAYLDRADVVANLAFGVAFIPAMLLLAKRFVDRFRGSPVMRSLLDDLAGHSLSSAARFLEELDEIDRNPALGLNDTAG